MTIKEKLEILAVEKNNPCVSISLNTFRTHPENAQDKIVLKNLVKEATERVISEFGKREVQSLLENLESIESMVDVNLNLDSLHIYASNDTLEIIKSPWPTTSNVVHIAGTFAIRPIVKAYNRSEEYLIVLLSQGGVQLFDTLNDSITEEVRNDDFPFSENRHYNTHSDKGSDPKHLDDLIREFLNRVDKAIVRVHNESGLKCVVVCTEDNYSKLMQVADRPNIYLGHAHINYNQTANHHIAGQAWEIVQKIQYDKRNEAIAEMQASVGVGNVYTDLQEIYQAALDGRGDLLIIHQDFAQPVLMTSERTFDLVDDMTLPGVIDDITSNIVWEVISKKGRVVFTSQDEMADLGQIVLKTRY